MASGITPFLWFDAEAEEAARFYASVFPHARILSISHYPSEETGREGRVMTVEFELRGQRFVALNGGPQFRFTEATSFVVDCEDQAEIDYYWERLSEGGEEGPCGWLKDRYGLSWQVVPRQIGELMGGTDPAAARRAFEAMMDMKKLDIAALQAAREGIGTAS